MKHCCESFGLLLDRAGEKGFSVIATNIRGNRRFTLQSRSLDSQYGDEVTIDAKDSKGDSIPLASIMELQLSHCPRCGADLGKLIRKNQVSFDILASSMSQYTLI